MPKLHLFVFALFQPLSILGGPWSQGSFLLIPRLLLSIFETKHERHSQNLPTLPQAICAAYSPFPYRKCCQRINSPSFKIRIRYLQRRVSEAGLSFRSPRSAANLALNKKNLAFCCTTFPWFNIAKCIGWRIQLTKCAVKRVKRRDINRPKIFDIMV